MSIQTLFMRRRLLSGLALGACLLWTHAASAEVTLLEKDGWSFFADGRINVFISAGFGDDFPLPSPNPDGGPPHGVVGGSALGAAGYNTQQKDANNKYLALRIRNGFLGNVLGFGIKRNLSETTTAKGYIGLWSIIESTKRDKTYFNQFDVREGYVTLDGPWGTLTAGRQLGLFGRTSTEIDFNYGHNYGVGFPCGDEAGPQCGHIGTGVMFPGFAAGFLYSTPSLAGLKLHAGLYDPVRLLGAWNRAPIARPEGAITFEQKFSPSAMMKLGVEGMIQPVARVESTQPGGAGTAFVQNDKHELASGIAGGGRFEAGPVRFGAAAFRGHALGFYYVLHNSPVVFDPNYDLRSFTGLYAQAALVFGSLQISAGAGQARSDQLPADKTDATLSNAKSQTGISAAVYYSLSESLVLGLDYFRFQTDWYGARRSTTVTAADGTTSTQVLPGVIDPEKQVVNFISVGATYHW